MAENENPTIAFVLSLIGGILILVSGIMLLALGTFVGGMMGRFYGGMMGGYPGVGGYFASMMAVLGVGGIICGIIVLIGAYLLNSNPASHATWGAFILVFSVLSLFEGGGYIIGAILGIVGGILGITWKPPAETVVPKKTD